jgi:hypothetical protein
VSARTRRWAPPAVADGAATRLLDVTPSQGYDAPPVAQLALRALALLRMPPWQLAGHLPRKRQENCELSLEIGGDGGSP